MDNKEIEIKKAKVKSGMFLAYEYSERTLLAQNNVAMSSDAPIHPDLENAFKKLVPHFALLTEEVSQGIVAGTIEQNYPFHELLDKFTVTGFSLGGSGDSEGVVIIGNKELVTGKKVNFNSPFQTFYDDSSEAYPYTHELKQDVNAVIYEVEQYMEGKQADPPMKSLFDGFEDDEQEDFKLPSDEELGDSLGEKFAEGFNGTVTVTANGKSKTFGKKNKSVEDEIDNAEAEL